MLERIQDELTGPAAWIGSDIQSKEDWIHQWRPESLDELDAALMEVKKAGLKIPFDKADFPLATAAEELNGMIEDVSRGKGFVIARGIPRDKYSQEECELLYWGIGVNIGFPVSQNARGHLLGHVMDEGRFFVDPMARGYQTAQEMDFHCDFLPVDVLGLFCLQQAKQGGLSHLVSSLTVHNVVRRERPDLLEVLYEPFYMDWRGEEPEGYTPWMRLPMFSAKDGHISARFGNRSYYKSCERFGPEYAPTERQLEALDLVQEIARRPELRISMMFQEGDIQLINNHATMHGRDAFEDDPGADSGRHLLRMWIGLADDKRQPLSSALDERYEIVRMGGIPVKDV